MSDDDDKPGPSRPLAMTPQLQMAIRLLQQTSSELFATVARWRDDHPGAIADLAPGDTDPLDEQEVESAEESGQPPWYFTAETPLPALELIPDVWVFGNPPQARANPGAVPRIKAVFDEITITRSAADVHEASWLARSLRQRAKTYERVVAAIVQLRPQLAIATEPAAVEPVSLRAVAEAVGMHESTVARLCTACRYQTIHGVVQLVEILGKIRSRPV